MKNLDVLPVFDLDRYINQKFNNLILENSRLESIEFENCHFKQCKLTGVVFSKVKFTDCDFEACDLSLAKFPGCKLSEVSFKNSKLAGINWTELSWPLVKLTSPVYFYASNVSHSSFFGLELNDLIMEDCKAHNVDFREAHLNHASLMGTDLQSSLFMHTHLKHADFTNAINYSIDIHFNTLTHASFSFPDVVGLLNSLNIKINDWPNDTE